MKTISILLLTVATLSAGPKADYAKKLMDVRAEILEHQRLKLDQKQIEELTKLLNALPKSDLQDQIAIQKEIWKLQFLGTYKSKGNSNFVIRLRDDGIAYQPGGNVGNWRLTEREGRSVFIVSVGDWSFTLPADAQNNYPGTIHFKNGGGTPDGLIRVTK